MTTVNTADIRQSFLEFFQKRDHKLVPSSPVIPFDDPTILFINAGMNQFKDVFTGRRKTDYKRATSVQKCIRAGGKHNDLDNVGFTASHHTFFEMLGNFSFGDYFKEEAIAFAWQWVTKDLGLPKDRLFATVYDDDDVAFELWEKIAPELKNGRVMRFGKKDNYWSMGDIGPCGPCSEIHFDRGERFGTGSADVINGETDRFVEIWNLVFMQFEQMPDGKIVTLPEPSVDTGAGLERIAAILQDADTNYGIDIFQSLISTISDLTGCRYADHVSSHHVVADHVRALAFSIADGVGISNEGRGYVLRRILRRAARHGRNLGANEPFIHKLVPVLVDEMGSAYPELREKQAHIMNVIKSEEEAFGRTLETGLELFTKIASTTKTTGSDIIDGEDVFRLYDTYGFPYDLTEILASEQGLALDRGGFDRAMVAQQERSRAAGNFSTDSSKLIEALNMGANVQSPTEFIRDELSTKAIIEDVSPPGKDSDEAGPTVVILDRTPFYAEAGGQVGDTGIISSSGAQMTVESVLIHRGLYHHLGVLSAEAKASIETFQHGATVIASVDADRRWDIMRNHTATHLAHAALRQVLGDHVKQSGSYVGPDRLRFDFSHHQPMTPDEIEEVERIVNEQILKGTDVIPATMDIEAARQSGAMALFGEKYEDKVRVISVGDFSKELCGGTHVNNVSQIGPFFVRQETGIASGVRRLEAITGREAIKYMLEAKQFRREASLVVGRPEPEVMQGIEQLRDNNAALQKELKKTRAQMFSGASSSVGREIKVGPIHLRTHDFGSSDKDTISAWVDSQKGTAEAVIAVAVGKISGKMTVVATASATSVKDHKLSAGALAKEILPLFGGRGGGKPTFAQGGVSPETKPDDLFEAVKEYLQTKTE